MSDLKVEVRGIRELSRALKKVSAETQKELRDGMKAIATKVADRARAKVPYDHGDARASIKPRGTAKGAGIAFGGAKAPYYPWLDFGGTTGRGHRPRVPYSGVIERPFLQDGRYVYPTIKEMNEEIKQDVDDLLERVIKNADFETKGGE